MTADAAASTHIQVVSALARSGSTSGASVAATLASSRGLPPCVICACCYRHAQPGFFPSSSNQQGTGQRVLRKGRQRRQATTGMHGCLRGCGPRERHARRAEQAAWHSGKADNRRSSDRPANSECQSRNEGIKSSAWVSVDIHERAGGARVWRVTSQGGESKAAMLVVRVSSLAGY